MELQFQPAGMSFIPAFTVSARELSLKANLVN